MLMPRIASHCNFYKTMQEDLEMRKNPDSRTGNFYNSEKPAVQRKRSLQHTEFITLDSSRCAACWKCMEACSSMVLGRVNLPFHKHALVENPGMCNGCLACADTCGLGAIQPAGVMKKSSQGIHEGSSSNEPSKHDVNRLNKRGVASLVMLWSMILLVPSGIMLHGTDGSFSVLRHGLMTVHNFSAMVFAAAAACHIAMNWKAIKNYIAGRVRISGRPGREMMLSLVIVFGTVGFFLMHVFHAHRG